MGGRVWLVRKRHNPFGSWLTFNLSSCSISYPQFILWDSSGDWAQHIHPHVSSQLVGGVSISSRLQIYLLLLCGIPELGLELRYCWLVWAAVTGFILQEGNGFLPPFKPPVTCYLSYLAAQPTEVLLGKPSNWLQHQESLLKETSQVWESIFLFEMLSELGKGTCSAPSSFLQPPGAVVFKSHHIPRRS